MRRCQAGRGGVQVAGSSAQPGCLLKICQGAAAKVCVYNYMIPYSGVVTCTTHAIAESCGEKLKCGLKGRAESRRELERGDAVLLEITQTGSCRIAVAQLFASCASTAERLKSKRLSHV